MRKLAVSVAIVICALSVMATAMAASSVTRIKDIAKVQGVRTNQLVGYGLVTGLAGTGDSNTLVQTRQSTANMLKSFGITVNEAQLKSKNVAAVMVTAQLPAFAKPGDTIDMTISSMGDAKSLQGGILLQTPLRAANGQVYAVGQGPVSTGGYNASSGGSSQQKNFPTTGTTPNGAIVERDVPTQLLSSEGSITLSLSQPDFTTATRIADTIDSRFGSITNTKDPGTIVVTVPSGYGSNVVGFIAAIEELYINPDNIARIVINERTGTIVMGSNVSIDEVAVAQGGLSISITKTTDVSQPPPFSNGSTVITNSTAVDVKEDKANIMVLPSTASVGDVVRGLNAIGATPRDIISILQAIKAAGALHADLQII